MKSSKVSGMRGWTDIGSDVNWDDYGGMWARRAKDGTYYVIRFTNLPDVCGSDADGMDPYEAAVMHFDLANIDPSDVASALKSCGWTHTAEGIVNDYDGEIVAAASDAVAVDHVIISAVMGYSGSYYQVDCYHGKRAANVRANARRSAERSMSY